MDVYETIYTTRMTIIEILILFRDNLAVHITIPTTHITPIQYPSMTNGGKEESYLLTTSNLSSDFSSGGTFLLLPVPHGGLDSALLDARHM